MYVYFVISIGAIAAMFVIAQVKWSVFTRYIHPWLVKQATLLGAYRSLIAIVGFPVIIVGGILAYMQIVERLGQPEVGLHFGRATNTVVWVTNLSNVVVHKPKYHVALFNLDESLEKRLNPLPIPVKLGDYIRVWRSLGTECDDFHSRRIRSGSNWQPSCWLGLGYMPERSYEILPSLHPTGRRRLVC